MLIFKLALRGLWRHRMRTVITTGAIAFGTFYLLVFVAVSEGGLADMVELAVRQGSAGHVVVQAQGYKRTAAVDRLVERSEEVRARIRRTLPESRVVRRVFGGGLAASASDSVGIRFMGVEPALEAQVSQLAKRVREGVYLGADAAQVSAAEARARRAREALGIKPAAARPSPAGAPGVGTLWCARPARAGEMAPRPVVLGRQLARTLRLGLCDKVVIRAQGLGAQQEGHFRIVGLFETGSADLDGFFAQIPLADAQRLLRLEGGVHQVAVMVDSIAAAERAGKQLRRAFKGDDSLEILTWDQAMPEMAEFVWFKAVSGWVFVAVVILIVAIGVANTVFMSVMERTREFGVMRALGAGPGRIFGLVLTEGALLGLLGVLVGLALAMPMLYYLANTGIQYKEPVDVAGVAIDAVRAQATPLSLFFGCLGVLFIAVVASVLPAIRAARLRVLKALHAA